MKNAGKELRERQPEAGDSNENGLPIYCMCERVPYRPFMQIHSGAELTKTENILAWALHSMPT